MSISEKISRFHSKIESNGFRMAIVAIQRLADLEKDIGFFYKQGVFEGVFYRERLMNFEFEVPKYASRAASIIITATPQPQQKISFQHKGKPYRFIIPPTYSLDTDKKVQNILLKNLSAEGFSLYPISLPLKLLSVRGGIAKYGRNNVAYIDGMTSFYRLKAFLSDLPSIEDPWFALQQLEQCNKCTACINKCPTKAITPERFLIRAEKCLTFHNERADRFPEWIDPLWHNCLVGCMLCQSVCPMNKDFISWSEEAENFTEEETETILRVTARSQIPWTAVKKLKKLYLLEDWYLIARNLRVLIDRHHFLNM